MNLLPTLSPFTNGDGDPHKVAARLVRFDQKQAFAVLFPAGLISEWGRIERVLQDAEAIVRSGQAHDPDGLARDIQSIHELQEKLCQPMANPDKGDASTTEAGGFGNRLQDAWQGLGFLNTSPAQKVGLTFTLVAILILLVYGINALKCWIGALIYNRMACQIPATLEIGLDVIDGYIVILGLHECAFRPVNSGAYARLVMLSDSKPATLYCSDTRLRAEMMQLKKDVAVYAFDHHLPANLHRALLDTSLVAPSYVSSMHLPKLRKHTSARTAGTDI